MNSHLDRAALNALADGELAQDQLAAASEHLAGCATCTSDALHLSLLKSATARAGQRYTPPPQLVDRLTRLVAQDRLESQRPERDAAHRTQGRAPRILGWAIAAVLVAALAGVTLVERNTRRAELASAAQGALVTEAFDQHVAAMAGGNPPEVLSSDRHTVKPWFQGRIPFSFNLPEKLPTDTTLDGANLAYLDGQPVAQLLFSIGKHHVSVFVFESRGAAKLRQALTEDAGFHVMEFNAEHLEGVAVSDVDPARLAELVNAIRTVQTKDARPAK